MASSSEALVEDMVRLPVYRWDRVAVVPRKHPLARRGARLDLHDLARYPLVSYLFSDRPESSLMGSFAQAGLTPEIAFTARDSDVIKSCVRNGLGVGVIAAMAIDSVRDQDLVALPAQHLLPTLTTWVGWRRDQLLRTFHSQFLRLLAPHLDAALIDDAVRGRPIPDLETLTRQLSLPSFNQPPSTGDIAA
jgi:LysR family cys regulon transcriptional activator